MAGRVVIIGGGFSGAMLAARLAEAGVGSALIERSGRFGPGAAYSTPHDAHLLNVRANRMSAVEGRPADFADWLSVRHPDHADPEGFAPRRLYGLYVQDRLAEAEAAHPGRIERIIGAAERIETDGVVLADGRRIGARAVVLATGNPQPGTARLDSPRVAPDPWAPGVVERVAAEDDVLILGCGLTMVDMILALDARGWRGSATALSRRGLSPRAHSQRHEAPAPLFAGLTHGPASARLRAGRRQAETEGWRPVMEALRPVTADLWAMMETPVRARMLRHLRPWWDVHRHRIAPKAAQALDRLTAEGRLTIEAGRTTSIHADADTVTLSWAPRGGGAERSARAPWLIDCSGPGHDAARDPLTAPLIAAGRARIDALGLGLDLDGQGRVLNAEGRADPRLFVLGPPARAAFWETIAVPDIRGRIAALARTLAEMERTP